MALVEPSGSNIIADWICGDLAVAVVFVTTPTQIHNEMALVANPQLIVVFVHGFKGTDSTFGEYPARLKDILSKSLQGFIVDCVIFPVYETKGDLTEAVERFVEWLKALTAEREGSNSTHGVAESATRANIVLCGHSMGGIIVADALLMIANSRPDMHTPLWPNVVACIAFDTPYFGLHPEVFKNTATKAVEYGSAVRTAATGLFGSFAAYSAKKAEPVASPSANTSKSAWRKWAPAAFGVGGALLAGAAGTAYYTGKDLGLGTWVADHMKYVGNLWDEDALQKRMEKLIDVEETLGVTFRAFYTIIPPVPLKHPSPRTFIILPLQSSRSFSRFWPAPNSMAADELKAHTGMFEPRSNDGYYELGLQTANFIRDSVIAG